MEVIVRMRAGESYDNIIASGIDPKTADRTVCVTSTFMDGSTV